MAVGADDHQMTVIVDTPQNEVMRRVTVTVDVSEYLCLKAVVFGLRLVASRESIKNGAIGHVAGD